MILLLIMIILLMLVLAGLVNVVVAVKLVRAFRLLAMRPHVLPPEDDLPSVTVCIPARNEIHGMTQCLDRVVSSDYPKLEIIVLDDESKDETSVLIKSYAASGVRFVEGKPLPDGWLGKNHAQNLLAHEASGSVVFFMDVDTLIRPNTVSTAVAYMLGEGVDMVSVIPTRQDVWRASAVFATLRHFWTVARFHVQRPRAASNAWLIKRGVLLQQLENTALATSVQMETTIASQLAANHAYRLVLSDDSLGLTYEKKWRSQLETSIRLLYPQCHKRWYQTLGLMGVLALLLVPYVAVVWVWQALVVIILQYFVYRYYLSRVWTRHSSLGALVLPVILAQEIVLLLVSMWRYNYGQITWKGRPIAHPAVVKDAK